MRKKRCHPPQPPQIRRKVKTTKRVNADRAASEGGAICSEVMKAEVSGGRILEVMFWRGTEGRSGC